MKALSFLRSEWIPAHGILAGALALVACVIPALGLAQTTVTEKVKGISYAAWWPGDYQKRDADVALGKLAATGARDVSIIVTQYQATIDSTTIAPGTSSPTDEDVTHAIRAAHRLGLRVLLKPHVDLSADPSHWRGEIGQNFSESQWAQWFSSYENFIRHYARLAAQENVERFCVGTELAATEGRAAQWRAIVAAVRAEFAGPLVYAANHPDAAAVSWWDALDLIGVDAYYPLTTKDDPTTGELAAAWAPIVANLATLSQTWQKPIVFTEIGYRSLEGANKAPWDWQSGGPWDLKEQEDCYRAAFEAVWNQPWFAGMYWWAWETNPLQGGPCDNGYTPANKPAENVVRQWYGAPPRVHTPPPVANPGKSFLIFDDELGGEWQNWSWWATVDFAATDYVSSGTKSIAVTLSPWGGLQLYNTNGFSTAGYAFLEFYARKSSSSPSFRVFFGDEQMNDLRRIPLEDCRYTAGVPIAPEQWTLVRIPLDHLEATSTTLRALRVQNWSDVPAQIWLDSIRLVGGQ